MKWIEGGEQNTKFLHTSVIAKHAKRRVTRLKDSQGRGLIILIT